MSGNIETLPKWAQHEIWRLKGEVERLKKQQAEVSSPEPTEIQYGFSGEKLTNLPNGCEVLFHFRPDRSMTTGIRCQIVGRSLYVNGGSYYLVVKPAAANAIEIQQENLNDVCT